MQEYTKVARIEDLNPHRGTMVSVGEKEIALFLVNDTVYALDNTCLHRGGPLGEGTVEGTRVTCPWHAWQYDVTTGCNPHNPAVKVRCYPVRVAAGEILVAL